MEVKIVLDTMTDIQKFVNTVSGVEEKVTLKDGSGHCVSAKSLLGAIYTMEWKDIYCHCERDITTKIMPWVI